MEGQFEWLNRRFDGLHEALREVKTAIAVSTAKQERNDGDIRELHAVIKMKLDIDDAAKAQAKIEASIKALEHNFDLGRQYITQYQGDRRFVFGVIAAVTVILGAVNGVAVKVAQAYFDELEKRVSVAERRAADSAKDALFEAQKTAADVSSLRDKIIEIHGAAKK